MPLDTRAEKSQRSLTFPQTCQVGAPKIEKHCRTGLKIPGRDKESVTHGRARLSTGVQLHYYIAGKGAALMLQHDVPKTSSYWHKVLPYPTPHFTVIAAEMRGLGDSTYPESG